MLKCNVNTYKKGSVRGKHRCSPEIDSWREGKEKKTEKGGKHLENGPYISSQTKGASETVDLFITTLIWPQDKKATKQIKSP